MQRNWFFQRTRYFDWKINKGRTEKSFIRKTQHDFVFSHNTLWLCFDPKRRGRNQIKLDTELRNKLQKKFGTLKVFNRRPWIKDLQSKFERYDSLSPNICQLQTQVLQIINSSKEQSLPYMGSGSWTWWSAACITSATWFIAKWWINQSDFKWSGSLLLRIISAVNRRELSKLY